VHAGETADLILIVFQKTKHLQTHHPIPLKQKKRICSLNVLFSEMDRAEIVVIKERGMKGFLLNPPAPHPLRAI
jgi:hypothetical protein